MSLQTTRWPRWIHSLEGGVLILGVLLSIALAVLDWHWERHHGADLPALIAPAVILVMGLLLSGAAFLLIRGRSSVSCLRRIHEEKLRLVSDAAGLGLWEWDLETRHLAWSWHHERLFGFMPGEFDGTVATSFSRIHPDDRGLLEAAVTRAAAQAARLIHEFRVIWPDGSEHWILAQAETVCDLSGKSLRLVGTAMDITARKDAELQLRCFQQIVETSSEGLAFFDRDLCIQVANPAYAALRHCAPAELRGQHLREMLGSAAYARALPELEAALAGERRHFRDEMVTPDGHRHYLEIDYEPFWVDGAVVGLVASLHNVTAAHEARVTLERERAQLEQRVAERTAELQGSEAKLRTIFEVLPIGVSITDPGGRIVDCNRAAETLLGLSRAAHLRRCYDSPAWQLIQPDGRVMRTEDYPAALALREHRPIRDVELGVTVPDGVTWLSASAMPTDHPDYGVVVAFVDITARKAAEVQQQTLTERLQLATDAGGIGVWEWDIAADRLIWDARMFALYGVEMADFGGCFANWSQCVHPEDLASVQADFAQALEGAAPFEFEFRVRKSDGSLRWMATLGKVLSDAKARPTRAIGVNWDITDRKAAEQDIERARELAERASRAKSTFLAQMSHEIRTPMNGILGLAEITLHKARDPEVLDDLEHLRLAAQSLLGLLNDILDQAKIEAGELQLEQAPFDLATLLEALGSLFAPIASNKGLRLRIEADPNVPTMLKGDLLRLRQVLSNLLSNAIKFTHQGEVRLAVQRLADNGHSVLMRWSVQDTGIGMDSNTLSRLFKPFSQGDASIARRFGGSGLGLSICQHLVALMGSHLDVASQPEHGSCFSFNLELELGQDIPEPQEATIWRSANFYGVRVLVAEDQPVNQRVISKMLDLLDVQHDLVNDGIQALQRLAADHYDAVLMDIQMPGMDGLTATRQLRQRPSSAELPVIALTAGVTEAERDRIVTAGLNDLLPKPVSLDALRLILTRWLPRVAPDEAAKDRPSAASPVPVDHHCVDHESELTLAGFDLSALHNVFTTSGELTEFLGYFAESVITTATALDQAAANQDWAAIQASAHRIKGTAANAGATTLSHAAEQLEQAVKTATDPQSSEFQDQLAAVRQVMTDTLHAISTLPGASTAARGSGSS